MLLFFFLFNNFMKEAEECQNKLTPHLAAAEEL
jgi:hypothetical protein